MVLYPYPPMLWSHRLRSVCANVTYGVSCPSLIPSKTNQENCPESGWSARNCGRNCKPSGRLDEKQMQREMIDQNQRNEWSFISMEVRSFFTGLSLDMFADYSVWIRRVLFIECRRPEIAFNTVIEVHRGPCLR